MQLPSQESTISKKKNEKFKNQQCPRSRRSYITQATSSLCCGSINNRIFLKCIASLRLKLQCMTGIHWTVGQLLLYVLQQLIDLFLKKGKFRKAKIISLMLRKFCIINSVTTSIVEKSGWNYFMTSWIYARDDTSRSAKRSRHP